MGGGCGGCHDLAWCFAAVEHSTLFHPGYAVLLSPPPHHRLSGDHFYARTDVGPEFAAESRAETARRERSADDGDSFSDEDSGGEGGAPLAMVRPVSLFFTWGGGGELFPCPCHSPPSVCSLKSHAGLT